MAGRDDIAKLFIASGRADRLAVPSELLGRIAINQGLTIEPADPRAGPSRWDGAGEGSLLRIGGNDDGAVTLRGLHFSQALAERGGVLVLQARRLVTIEGCLFDSCGATVAGGAIAATDGELVIRACTFRGLRARHGAAVSLSHRGRLRLSDCRFEDCQAELGGVLFLSGTSQAHVERCQFHDLRAQRGGAFAFISDSPAGTPLLTIEHCDPLDEGAIERKNSSG